MKRITAFLLALLCMSAVSGACGEDLLLCAVNLACDLDTLAESPAYSKTLGGSETIQAYITQFAEGEYAEPSAVWRIKLKADALIACEQFAGEALPREGLVARELLRRLLGSSISFVNAAEGVEALSAANMLLIDRAFPMGDLENGCLYILEYENGFPVSVSFWPEGNGVVMASASFVVAQDPIAGFQKDLLAMMFDEPEKIQ